MKYSPKEMQNTLQQNNFNFKKSFGQNFIIDENIITSIIKKSEVDKDTLVIEIGPGAGSLTAALSKSAKEVLCYEIDTNLKQILDKNLKDCSNIEIKYEDFLTSNIENDIKKREYTKIYVIANLPYYITTPIIMKLVSENIPIDKIVVMVQKEVGNRMKAETNTKDYNSLSIFLQYYFDIKKILDVSRNVFIPKPNVDSIVIELKRKTNQYPLKNKQLFFQLIKDSFKQKRKTIKNNLKEYNLETIEQVLKQYHLDLSARAEQISIQIFVDIANQL